jgi:hypothetical protein
MIQFGAFFRLGAPAVERVDHFERRRELAAAARLDLETDLAFDTRLEAAKVRRDLDQAQLRNLDLARKLRGAPHSPRREGQAHSRRSIFDGQPRDAEPDEGAGGAFGLMDATDDSLSIEEWLEREYERFQGAVAEVRRGAAL